jgi:hypothetical protein
MIKIWQYSCRPVTPKVATHQKFSAPERLMQLNMQPSPNGSKGSVSQKFDNQCVIGPFCHIAATKTNVHLCEVFLCAAVK